MEFLELEMPSHIEFDSSKYANDRRFVGDEFFSRINSNFGVQNKMIVYKHIFLHLGFESFRRMLEGTVFLHYA